MGTELMLADSFRFPIIDKLIDTASSYLEPSELEGLRKASPHIQAILSADEQGQFKAPNLKWEEREWLQKLKDAVDELEYILDEMEYMHLENQGMGEAENKVSGSASKSASRFKNMFIKYFFKRTSDFEKESILKRLRRALLKLYPVAIPSVGLLLYLQLTVGGLTNQQQNELHRFIRISPAMSVDFIFSSVTQKAIKMLTRSSNGKRNASVVSIVGTHGVWKTIFAQILYKHQRIKETFAAMMWICVSSTFDGALLLREVIARISHANVDASPPPCDGAPLEALQAYVKQELAFKEFLLVLDDVWLDEDTSEWEKFAATLINSRSRTKILLTTRMDATAHLIGEVLDLDPHSLSRLTEPLIPNMNENLNPFISRNRSTRRVTWSMWEESILTSYSKILSLSGPPIRKMQKESTS